MGPQNFRRTPRYAPSVGYRMPYNPAMVPRIDARAPMSRADQAAADRGTNASPLAGKDWNDVFHKDRQGYNPAGTAAGSSADGAGKGPSTIAAAPANIQGSVVQGLLDRASGTKTPPPAAAPLNPGAVARATGQQQQTQYGTVGGGKSVAKADGTPIMEHGQQVGIQGSAPQGPPAPTLAETRQSSLAKFPAIGQAGTPENAAFVAAAKQGGEAAAHANLDTIMKPLAVGPPAPTPSDQATMAYTQSRMQPGLEKGAPHPGKDIAAATRRDAAIAEENPQPSAGAREVSALSGLDAWKSGIVHLAQSTMPGGSSAPAPTVLPPTVQPDRQPYVPAGPVPLPAPAAPGAIAAAPPEEREDTVPNLAGGYVPNYADGVLSRVGDKIADFADPDDRAWRAAQPGKLLPDYFPAAGARSKELMAGAPPRTPYVPAAAASRDRSTASNTADGDVPNYAGGELPEEQPVFQSTQPTGNMKAAIIAEKNDLNAAGFHDQAKAAGTADATGTWSSQPKVPNPQADSMGRPAGMPAPASGMGNPMSPPPAPSGGPRKLTAHDFDNQWPDPAGLRGRVAGVPSVMGSAGGSAGAGRPTFNFARGYVPGGGGVQSSPGMKPAIRRERQAIAHRVGGARPGVDKPEPVMLGNRPAVINSSERVVPTPNGPAVLNRKMQRKGYVPGRS